jgi:sulfoxide reductase heme-binding subunit YedZ
MTNALWYLGRGFGVSALVIFSLVTALGLLVRGGRPLPGLPRFALTSIHRSLSLAGLALVGVHVLTLLADPYAQLRLADVVLPFLGRRRPMWLGLGTLALDLVVLLVVSSLVRDRIGLRAWRALHWLAYACWPVAVLHAAGNGTDRSRGWLQLIEVCCVISVAAALLVRLAVRQGPRPRPVQPPPGLAGLR